MKKFAYKAKKGPSELLEGSVSAETRDSAIDKINDLGLVPVDVWEMSAGGKDGRQTAAARIGKSGPRIRSRDLLLFYRQLAKLMKSGVPLLQALFLILQENENLQLKKLLESLHKEVREGNTLSSGMVKNPQVFSAFDVGMIQTGEAVGKLDEVLLQIAEYRSRQRELSSKVKTALAYPSFVMVMGFLTLVFMLTYVIPKFTGLFADLGQELPLPTRILMGVSAWFQTQGPFLLAGACAVVILFMRALRSPKGKEQIDRSLLRLPGIGKVILKSEIARFSRTLELLLKSGIPMLKALRIAEPVLQNRALGQELFRCHSILEDGGYLSDGLRKGKYFPSFVCYFIAIGEESGKLDESLQEIADWYEKDTAEAIKIMTTLLEPTIILIVGGLLAAMIMAVLLPVFSINTMMV